jgi:hypothetical protein
MAKSIFTDNFPEIKTGEELEKVKNQYPNYDPYYIASGCIKERREKFDRLWEAYQLLADKNFLSDIKKHFHQRTWEMYLGVALVKNSFDISSFNQGPDFIINKGKTNEFFIEAVACEKGDSKSKVPDMVHNIVQDVPEEEMLIRLANSLDSKYKKYKDFIRKENKPYIIAVNKGELGYIDPQIPLILKCLFGIEFEHFKKINDKFVYAGWTKREFIEKENKATVPMTFFENEEHKIVSAVIYSNKTVLNHPDKIGLDCIVIHNPNALNPVDEGIFRGFIQYKKDGDSIKKYERGHKITKPTHYFFL